VFCLFLITRKEQFAPIGVLDGEIIFLLQTASFLELNETFNTIYLLVRISLKQ